MPTTDSPLVTVTLNPALDVSTSVDTLTPDNKLRCDTARREPGGGGINVTRVAARLGCRSTAVAVIGGATGRRLVSLMAEEGLAVEAVEVETDTRECFAVWERSTERQYRFVLPGPEIDRSTLEQVADAVHRCIASSGWTGGDSGAKPVVVLSGSMPPGSPSGGIIDLAAALSDCELIVDTGGSALLDALASRAALVKPSARELATVVDRTLETEADILDALVEVRAEATVGAILVSIGAGGAFLALADQPPIRLRAPAVKVRSTIGAGDSMVGGAVVGLARGHDMIDAARLGVAAGTATVLSEGSGLCLPADVDRLLPLVTVT
jgi:6-phosphofructokinase 2